MKTYILDTNVLLRFALNDNKEQVSRIEGLFRQAQKSAVSLIVPAEVLFEVEYVLRGVYKIEKDKRITFLELFLHTPFITIREDSVFREGLVIYKTKIVDLMDCYLFSLAQSLGATVFSFDRDFEILFKGKNSAQ